MTRPFATRKLPEWFHNKKVFITGGSSGIGLATAAHLVRAGAHVAIGARSEERLQAAQASLGQSAEDPAQKVVALRVDVSDKGAVEQARDSVLEQLGGIDILINNAGITRPGPIQELDDAVFESMMRVNYFGTVTVTRAFLPQLRRQRSGHITNVSSLLGFMGIFGYTAYAASKFAIVGFSECLRQELLPHGVGVSVVYPPDTDTPQLAEENLIKPAETKAVAGNVKVMSAEAVAQTMLDGIVEGRVHIVPGMAGKLTHFAYRHFPWVVRKKIDSDVLRCSR